MCIFVYTHRGRRRKQSSISGFLLRGRRGLEEHSQQISDYPEPEQHLHTACVCRWRVARVGSCGPSLDEERERERERESLGIQTVGLSVQFQSAHTALSELSEANKNTESFTATDKWHPALRRALATSRFSFHFYSFPLLLQISVDIPKQRLFFFFLFVFFFCRFLPRE